MAVGLTIINSEYGPLIPESAVVQLRALAQLLERNLEGLLRGVILHGSAATAGFELHRSDLDVLAIVAAQLTAKQPSPWTLAMARGAPSGANRTTD